MSAQLPKHGARGRIRRGRAWESIKLDTAISAAMSCQKLMQLTHACGAVRKCVPVSGMQTAVLRRRHSFLSCCPSAARLPLSWPRTSTLWLKTSWPEEGFPEVTARVPPTGSMGLGLRNILAPVHTGADPGQGGPGVSSGAERLRVGLLGGPHHAPTELQIISKIKAKC